MLDECYKLYYRAKNKCIDPSELRKLVFLAYDESPVYCMKTLLLIRGNKSIEARRWIFTESLKLIHPIYVSSSQYWMDLIRYIPLVGRWDDLLYSWVNSDSFKYRYEVGSYIRSVYIKDLKEVTKGNLPRSLLSKWLPSYNNSKSSRGYLYKLLLKTLRVDRETYKKEVQLMRSKVDSIIDTYSSKICIDEFTMYRTSDELMIALDSYFKCGDDQ